MSTRAALRALVVASVVGAGCSDPNEPPLPAFSVSPARQWSGGPITFRSAYFAARAHDPGTAVQAPVVVAGSDTMLLLPGADDTTMVTQLALGPSETLTLSLIRGGRRDSIGTIERVGFSGKRTVTPGVGGQLLATDSAGAPFVLGGSLVVPNGDRQPVVRLRVVAGISETLTFREPSNIQYGMAPSIIPGAFTVRDATDSIRLASLLVDAPTIIDSMHRWGTGFTRQVAKISDSLWLVTNSHQSYTRPDSLTGAPRLVNTESPWAVFMSPSGNRTTLATVVPLIAGMGVPVWDNTNGTVAYTLPLFSTQAAAFSTNGGTLYIAGGEQYRGDTLVGVDAITGAQIFPRTVLPGGMHALALAYRDGPGGDQLLVGAATPTSLALVVYRASTLERLAILPTGDACPDMQTGPCFSGVVSMDNQHGRAYIVIPGNPTPIWSFDLLP